MTGDLGAAIAITRGELKEFPEPKSEFGKQYKAGTLDHLVTEPSSDLCLHDLKNSLKSGD